MTPTPAQAPSREHFSWSSHGTRNQPYFLKMEQDSVSLAGQFRQALGTAPGQPLAPLSKAKPSALCAPSRALSLQDQRRIRQDLMLTPHHTSKVNLKLQLNFNTFTHRVSILIFPVCRAGQPPDTEYDPECSSSMLAPSQPWPPVLTNLPRLRQAVPAACHQSIISQQQQRECKAKTDDFSRRVPRK